ncbi:mannosyltransferase [Neophaeococcomyces mojaviensis]|uniref:Mannosyltransferase n=1 Tax=Neophaeococcomyces mojaviensis TaxID=3383035 RepID=A0ACC3A197_9EURO|nr:mannosyltransferase [Knufia sp. JES_112]
MRRRQKHLAWTVLGIIFLTTVFRLYNHASTRSANPDLPSSTLEEREPNPLLAQHATFWRTLHSLILNNHPQTEKKPDLVVPRNPRISYDPGHAHPRPDVLWMDHLDVERMKNAHANFITDIRKLPATHGPIYNPGTRGIVTTASNSLLATLTISLHMLRKTGSTLPVEIFLERPSTHSQAFCTQVFPNLHAKCLYLSDIFDRAGSSFSLSTYQYKIFSILFSSFEDVLLLDSDAWPVSNPEPLFHSFPFTDTGMVLWPDFWYASESPYFFEIAKIKNPPTLEVQPATESGELMYSKSKHGYGIMLATYYNYYGPDYYYLLHSQDGPGQGDKETFMWAATALDEQYYLVHHQVTSLGRHDSNGEWIGTGMVQYDPIQDFFWTSSTASSGIDNGKTVTKARRTEPKPMFIHANHPKYDPYTIFDENINNIHTPTRDSSGSPVRCWFSSSDAVSLFGLDIERRFWEVMEKIACNDLKGLWTREDKPTKADIEEMKERDKKICQKVKDHIEVVFDAKTAEKRDENTNT